MSEIFNASWVSQQKGRIAPETGKRGQERSINVFVISTWGWFSLSMGKGVRNSGKTQPSAIQLQEQDADLTMSKSLREFVSLCPWGLEGPYVFPQRSLLWSSQNSQVGQGHLLLSFSRTLCAAWSQRLEHMPEVMGPWSPFSADNLPARSSPETFGFHVSFPLRMYSVKTIVFTLIKG